MALKTTEDSIVFACYSRSCAPPPVGKGGSVRGGRKGGSVIRKSGGGDSSSTRKVPGAGAKALTARYGTKSRGSKSGGDSTSYVSPGGSLRYKVKKGSDTASVVTYKGKKIGGK